MAPAASLLTTPQAVPPALSYRWEADGALEPETPLSASAPPAQITHGPVGSPIGDSFTVWQPGTLDYQAGDPLTGQFFDPGAYMTRRHNHLMTTATSQVIPRI